MSLNLDIKDFDEKQWEFIQYGIKKQINEKLLLFLANKKFDANKMWAMLFAVQNKITAKNIRILSNSNFDSSMIYKIIDSINDSIIDENFLNTYDFSVPFNIQFAIYKKHDSLSQEWKKFIVDFFEKDILLTDLDFLLSLIDNNTDLLLVKKYVKKPKDTNYLINLFSILKSPIDDDDFLKIILRENPNHNKTFEIIELKEYVENDLVKNSLLKLNVKQLQLIVSLYREERSDVIIDYLFNYKCRISNIDEVDIIRSVVYDLYNLKTKKDDAIKIIFESNHSPNKISNITEVAKIYNIEILKLIAMFNFKKLNEYLNFADCVKKSKLKIADIKKYFKSNFKYDDAKKQLENIISNIAEDELLDFVEKQRTISN